MRSIHRTEQIVDKSTQCTIVHPTHQIRRDKKSITSFSSGGGVGKNHSSGKAVGFVFLEGGDNAQANQAQSTAWQVERKSRAIKKHIVTFVKAVAVMRKKNMLRLGERSNARRASLVYRSGRYAKG
jgi:hypothetical protein